MHFSHIIFDWGDTLMRDFPDKPDPMCKWDTIEVIDGVLNTLPLLAEKYTLAVATNAGVSDTELMKQALKRGMIDSFFTFFFSSRDLGYSKPDSAFFYTICKKMNIRPTECIYVGNDYQKDIIGANRAGITSIFFCPAGVMHDKKEAYYTIRKFEELAVLLLS